MTSKILTQSYLNSILRYDDGKLFWKIQPRSRTKINDQAGSFIKTTGYISIGINKKRYLLHRIIFIMHHGYCPEQIDHNNHIRHDNHIENLRPANHQVNGRNQILRNTNTSTVCGVSWGKPRQKWIAQITVNKKNIYLGGHNNFNDAVEARQKANIKYGFHKNHGTKQCPLN